jgi:hypothetical protein
MSELTDAIGGLRAAVTASARSGDETALAVALEAAAFGRSAVSRVPGEQTLDHVSVELTRPVALAELEGLLGPAHSLPRRPEGRAARSVLFADTLPAEGESGATVLGELDGDGRVARLIVRADAF